MSMQDGNYERYGEDDVDASLNQELAGRVLVGDEDAVVVDKRGRNVKTFDGWKSLE